MVLTGEQKPITTAFKIHMGYLRVTQGISTGYLGDTYGTKLGCIIKLEEKKYNFFNKTVENYM